MSVYNGENYLREAIDSILNQTLSDFEFIIIDDGSTDESATIINSYSDNRIRLIQQQNKGLAAALNLGLQAAYGKYIARMDADDISKHDRLEKQVSFLENHPECVAVGSNAKIISMDGEYLYTSSKPETWEKIRLLLPSTPFFHSSTLYRKNIAIQCGGYYEKIKHHFEDMILWNKMARYGELRNIDDPLISYRILPTAISNRSVEASAILGRICRTILKEGELLESDLLLLRNITKKKSNRWKNSNYYLNIGIIFIVNNYQKKRAFENFLKAIFYNPFNVKAWFNFVLLIFPVSVIKKWKKHREVLNAKSVKIS